jgi:pimeloyl-ACP methyl ester carboxylesterase
MPVLSCLSRSLLLPLGGMLVAMPVYAAEADDAACQNLTRMVLPSVRITEAQPQPAQVLPPDRNAALTGSSAQSRQVGNLCLVRGAIGERKGVGEQEFATRFEMRLPFKWNGDFLFQGGGGMDGFVAPALGSIPSHGSSADPALVRGYAVVSMDGGHRGNNARFGVDQEARLDYAYASIGKVTTVAKQLIRQFYHQAPQKTVFMGCSNGGREAMIAAQRYPTEFDGIIAGDPGFRLSAAAIGQAWDTRHLMAIAPKNAAGERIFSQALTTRDLDLVSKSLLAVCDARDGIADGIINNPAACHFDPKVLSCRKGQKDGCLSAAKVGALQAIFHGARSATGQQLYSDWPYDAGINSPGWRQWKLGSSMTATPDARNITLGADSLPGYFMTPPQAGFNTLDFDFNRDPQRVAEMAALNDATSTMLSTFVQRNGKMIIFQGSSDPVFSANDIRRWYQELQNRAFSGDAQATRESVRLFMVPGMTHCGDGPALDDFDPLTALEKWMKQGQAPASLAASGRAFPGLHQPLCSYPRVAMYVGGDSKQLTSYRCQ